MRSRASDLKMVAAFSMIFFVVCGSMPAHGQSSCAGWHPRCLTFCRNELAGLFAECNRRCFRGLTVCKQTGCWPKADGGKICGLAR
jgi:hypothetical protein